MSSILEALRKLEEEKAVRRSGIGNIAGKVAANTRRNRQRPAWLVAAAMVAVAVAAIFGTYAVMRTSSNLVATVAVKPAASMPQPAASLPQAATPGITPPAPLPEASPLSQAKASPQKPAMEGQHSIAVAALKTAHARAPAQGGVKAAGNPSAQPSAGMQAPSIKVTGIAWQQDSGSRVAVVNGMPLTEESVIEGARIEEILPDSVRFSIKGKEFRIYVEKDPA